MKNWQTTLVLFFHVQLLITHVIVWEFLSVAGYDSIVYKYTLLIS